ncbi:MAG TPA: tetratricopeptide repeat protein [Anaeromyxobacteraceae bacterium]|nr:tetratricopeptide repeat protein [Anaeromyxobacteraceae bacterium]
MRVRILAVGVGLALAVAAGARTPEAEPSDLRLRLNRIDKEWKKRDQPGCLDAVRSELAQAERDAPGDYGVLWRMAQLYFWLADDPGLSSTERSRLGKKAWEYGDRASLANPKRVEGWYFAALGMGEYSIGIGVLKALGENIEDKFRQRLSKAESIDPTFYAGGIWNAWGRFYFKLPWPKYDGRRSEQMLHEALRVNPENVRARVFLAELYVKEKHRDEARKLLKEAATHQPGSYDVPEERRSAARARKLLVELKN